ncbi:flagellar biosynthetic protein FliO [bacterium]|nr:flagellar biosynthetic protein FliO [bacterium]
MKKLLLLVLILSLWSPFSGYGLEKIGLVDEESFEIPAPKKEKKPVVKKKVVSTKKKGVVKEKPERKTLSGALNKVEEVPKEEASPKDIPKKEQGVSLEISSLDTDKFLSEKIDEKEEFSVSAEVSPKANNAQEKRQGIEYEYDFWKFGSKVFFALGLILAGIYLIYRFLSNRQGGLSFGQEKSLTKILSTSALAPGRYLQLVEVGNKVLILGMSEKNITTLGEIKDQDAIDSLKVKQSKNLGAEGLPFAKHLKGFLGEHQLDSKILSPGESQKEKVLFLEKERERLKGLNLSHKAGRGQKGR